MDKYHLKTNAIEKIWYLAERGAKEELHRAVQIWKGRKQFDSHKLTKARALVVRRRNRNCQQAIDIWKVFNQRVEHASRVRIL